MTIAEFLRTSIFGITVSCTLAFIGALLLLSAAFYFGGAALWRSEIEEAVAEEYEAVSEDFGTGGLTAVKALIDERATPVIDEEGYIYLLQTPEGEKRAGQLSTMAPTEEWLEVIPPGGEEDEPFFAKGAYLPDGSFLLVGRDAHDLHDAVELVEEGIIWMLAIAVPLSLITAIISSALIFRRLEAINRLSLEIRHGRLDRRLPVSKRNDEFDRLASHLNAMLDGIQDLTESLRQVTNNIAHELRTPLNAILGYAELMQLGVAGSVTDQQSQQLDRINASAWHLLTVIEEILTFSRVEAGREEIRLESVDLKQLVEAPPVAESIDDPVDFPTWNRTHPVRLIRRLSQATWIVPLTRLFASARVDGLPHLNGLEGPVIFASNHQSHMDVPVILSALPGRWRSRVAPAMLKEFFTAHFHPEQHTWREVFTNSLNYYLACFYFNTFPIPQREAGARHTLRYMGELTSEGLSILIFPEGVRAATGDIKPFLGGVGMMASRLDLPVVPVRLDGLDRVLHPTWRFVRPGKVRVFVRSGATWTLQATLSASDAVPGKPDDFGIALALQDDRLVVGAPQGANPPPVGPGEVYVFERTGTTWTESEILFASDRVEDGRFGKSVALDGDTLAAAAGGPPPLPRATREFSLIGGEALCQRA